LVSTSEHKLKERTEGSGEGDCAGETTAEYKELHTVTVCAACGIRISKLDEDGQIIEETHKRKVLNEDNVEVKEEHREDSV
jgi:hypothetical protein